MSLADCETWFCFVFTKTNWENAKIFLDVSMTLKTKEMNVWVNALSVWKAKKDLTRAKKCCQALCFKFSDWFKILIENQSNC